VQTFHTADDLPDVESNGPVCKQTGKDAAADISAGAQNATLMPSWPP
jgi:hypothetical protein